MNWLDSVIASISPERAVRRLQARRVLAAYEAAKPTTLRKQSRDAGSGDRWVAQAGPNLRNQARFLDANHDLAKGVLNALVNNTVGANGIGIEPQPRTFGGEIHDDLADALLKYWKEWCKNPECTGIEDWPGAQRLLARSWFRDGEVFTKDLTGNVPFLDHATQVRFTLEMLEADMLPLIFDDPAKNIVQGIQRNAWGRATQYHFYRNHPGDINVFSSRGLEVIPVSADRINHLRTRERISQMRGVSVFAAVMTRLDDIKDYEESERIAAKIAASMAAFIKKGQPDMYEPNADGTPRSLRFQPGMVFDDLMAGEEIGMIDTNRPNPQLIEYRKGQLRAVASGTGANYSTIARDYDGSYSSQRQELVEGWANYQVLTAEFIKALAQPVWETFVQMAVADGLVKVPADIDPITLDDALFIGPSMPWIDPLKEVKGNSEGERNAYIAGPEIIRRRGGNPRDVLEQEARWRRMLKDKGLIVSSDPANDKGQPNELLQNQG
jgi:lambda family phage portal protein